MKIKDGAGVADFNSPRLVVFVIPCGTTFMFLAHGFFFFVRFNHFIILLKRSFKASVITSSQWVALLFLQFLVTDHIDTQGATE